MIIINCLDGSNRHSRGGPRADHVPPFLRQKTAAQQTTLFFTFSPLTHFPWLHNTHPLLFSSCQVSHNTCFPRDIVLTLRVYLKEMDLFVGPSNIKAKSITLLLLVRFFNWTTSKSLLLSKTCSKFGGIGSDLG